MAIAKQGNGYSINSGALPFTAPKKTNTKRIDAFNKATKKEEPKIATVEEIQQEPAPVEVTKEEKNVLVQESTSDKEATIEEPVMETVVEPIVPSKPVEKERNYKNASKNLADYTGARKNTTFAFCDSNDISYIKIKANRLGLTYQDYLAEILLENIETIKADNFDYTEETYQNTKTGLKNPVNDRFALKEDFLIDVKQAAANVGMKRSAFVAMCVHKSRKADPNPAWD